MFSCEDPFVLYHVLNAIKYPDRNKEKNKKKHIVIKIMHLLFAFETFGNLWKSA